MILPAASHLSSWLQLLLQECLDASVQWGNLRIPYERQVNAMLTTEKGIIQGHLAMQESER